MLLAYRFEIHAEPVSDPFGSPLLSSECFRVSGEDLRASARCRTYLPNIPDRLQDRRSPPGCYALGIKAPNPTPTRRLAFAIRPISVRSPHSVLAY